MKLVFFVLTVICSFTSSTAQEIDAERLFSEESGRQVVIVDVTAFGAKPNSGKDATLAVKSALAQIAGLNGTPSILRFPKGRYDFWASDAPKMHLPVTAVHQQWDFISGMYLEGLKHVTIDGCASELIFHSRMTPIILKQCEDVKIFNLTIDHVRPTVSEFTVRNIGTTYMEVDIHPDSWYVIEEGRFQWEGADGDRYTPQIFQSLDLVSNITKRVKFDLGLWAEEIGPRCVRFHYKLTPLAYVGQVWQMRGDGIRNQQGSVVLNSKDISWEDVNLFFCTGLGIVSQLSDNLTFRHVNIEPRKDSGRTCASFADGIHCCNCTGKVIIDECRIVGTQDDPVNVYGDDLIIKKREQPNTLLLSYSTWEQCGYQMLFTGDELMLLSKQTLLPFASRKVVSAELIDKMTHRVILDGDVSEDCVGQVAENRTRMPEILIRDCYFARIPTRGVLVSSWRKTLIENNTFFRTQMAAIFVCHGDDPYYQQGAVEDLTIRNNKFVDCVGCVFIQPDQPVVNRNAPVDKNLKITGNRFIVGNIERPLLWARSTKNIILKNNTIEVTKKGLPLVWLNGSSDVVIKNNIISGDKTGIIEVVDFDAELLTKRIIRTDNKWKIIEGILREGSK